MNIYVGCGTLQGLTWSGAPTYVYSILREMIRLGANDHFHFHLGRFASRNGREGEDKRLRELTSAVNVSRHDHRGSVRYHLAAPFGALLSRSKVYYRMEGEGARMWAPMPCRSATLVCDCGPFLFPQYYPFMTDPIERRKQYRRNLRSFDLVVTISDTVRDQLAEVFGIPEKRILVAKCAVDPPSPGSPEERPRELHDGQSFFLMVNPGRANKNWQGVLAAFSCYSASRKSESATKLILAGNLNDQADPIAKTIDADPLLRERVVRLGYVSQPQLRYLYRHARLAVYPSRYEGFGMPALEAMANELPLILSDIPIFQEVAAGAAFFVPLDDPHVMAAGFNRLDTDEALRSDLIRNGKAKAREHNWAASAKVTLEALAALAS